MKRLALAVAMLAVLVGLAGCTSVFGPGDPSDSQLNSNATYEWDTNATSSFVVEKTEFRGVIRVENRSWIKLYRKDELNNDEPLEVSALRFRYPNGTVVTANESSLDVSIGSSRVNATLPQAGGRIGFTADRPKAKRFSTPMFANGDESVEVTLPAGTRVGVPLLSQVRPGADDKWVEDDRMTVRWEETSRNVVLRYYLVRDLYVFGGLAGILTLVGVGGAVYYFRQIKVLERRREEIAPDVDFEDDDVDDGGPPPGMG